MAFQQALVQKAEEHTVKAGTCSCLLPLPHQSIAGTERPDSVLDRCRDYMLKIRSVLGAGSVQGGTAMAAAQEMLATVDNECLYTVYT